MIPFTSNYNDHSTEFGYQFEFICQRCGNGYASSFQKSAAGIGETVLRSAGSLFGGFFGNASYAGSNLADMARGTGRDKALTNAVEEMRPHFDRCPRCGEWVCKEVCWNAEVGQCAQCSPKVHQEIASLRTQATIQQAQAKLSQMDQTAGLDLKTKAMGTCPSCGQDGGGGKFCANCGSPLTAAACQHCNAPLKPGARFCNECGTAVA
jgi:hypothetical protein